MKGEWRASQGWGASVHICGHARLGSEAWELWRHREITALATSEGRAPAKRQALERHTCHLS